MTGHKLTKLFQEKKSIIKQFVTDFGCEVSETADSLILEKGGKSIEMSPKVNLYTDLNTKLSYEYFNERACLMKFFDCYTQY